MGLGGLGSPQTLCDMLYHLCGVLCGEEIPNLRPFLIVVLFFMQTIIAIYCLVEACFLSFLTSKVSPAQGRGAAERGGKGKERRGGEGGGTSFHVQSKSSPGKGSS